MEGFKEFNGKDLDSVINEACAYFAVPREKLEIEIIQDAKSGIFGIVGARKAKIRARRAPMRETVQNLLGKKHTENYEKPVPSGRMSNSETHGIKDRPLADRPDDSARFQSCAHKNIESESAGDIEGEETSFNSISALDADKLKNTVKEVVERLIEPVAGQEIEAVVEISGGRVSAHIDWSGDAGLIIGREGQTLEAFEYLASRMVSHAMQTGVRIQIDVGEYRARQEDKLRYTARILAEKALHTGKSYTTRPLSSYHRRIIHLALQDVPEIMTRSAGEGAIKRVVISAKRPGKA